MPIYNESQFLSLPQQVSKNKNDIAAIEEQIANVSVGPQGVQGPRGPQGIQGNVGPAGPDGTPVAGLSLSSSADGTLGGHSIELVGNIPANTNYRFIFSITLFDSNFKLYLNNVLQTPLISFLDFILIRYDSGSGQYRLLFYNENGEATTYTFSSAASIKINQSVLSFAMYQILNGSTVGPTGPAGAKGDQGEDGPQGPQGVQGLPGLQNISYLETLENEDLYDEITSETMIQLVGGDYDGLTFIKDEIVDSTFVKFGPYGSLVEFADGQVFLYQGVTSIKLYALDHLT